MHVRQKFGASERRACRVLGQSRSTQRRAGWRRGDEEALRGDVVKLASRYGRYGYRRVTALLKAEGWEVNHKRVERIWREEGLKVPRRQPKRARLWLNDGSCIRLRPTHRGSVWSYDFTAARTHDGRSLKLLTVLDEYTRECLAIVVERRIRSDDVLDCLTRSVRPPWSARAPALGQRAGVHGKGSEAVAGAGRSQDPVHRAGQPVGERLQREPQRQAEGRAHRSGDLLLAAGGPGLNRAVAEGVQHGAATQRTRLPTARSRGCSPVILVPQEAVVARTSR